MNVTSASIADANRGHVDQAVTLAIPAVLPVEDFAGRNAGVASLATCSTSPHEFSVPRPIEIVVARRTQSSATSDNRAQAAFDLFAGRLFALAERFLEHRGEELPRRRRAADVQVFHAFFHEAQIPRPAEIVA